MGIEPTILHYLTPVVLFLLILTGGSNEAMRIFFAGMFCHMGLYMAIQDWMGLEEWLLYAVPRWVNLSPIVGVLIVAASIAIYFIARNRVRKNAMDILKDANSIARATSFGDKFFTDMYKEELDRNKKKKS